MYPLFRNRQRYNSLRYAGRDYSLPGKYFVTICTAGTKEWFGEVKISKMYLSEIGHIASRMWYEIPVHFPFIGLDAFVVMPNHLHGIIVINRFIGTPIVGALHATLFPGSQDITILSSVLPDNYPESENIFQIMHRDGERKSDMLKIRPSLTTSKVE